MKHKITSFFEENKSSILKELFDFLAIPSVSADRKYDKDVDKAADWLVDFFKKHEITEVKKIKTKGHPIVFAEKKVDETLPTVLIYGHYDVQPPDPINLWKSPPFEPEIRDGKIFARGACDDKGQVYMHLIVYQFFAKNNTFPCNFKFLIEGEEEVSSENLEPFIKKHKDVLKSDVLLVSDTPMIDLKTPSMIVSLRGVCHFELEVETLNKDVHSGFYGGVVPNPIHTLARIVSQLHDNNGKLTIEGLYDHIQKLTKDEISAINEAPFNTEKIKQETGAKEILNEVGFTPIESNSIRHCLDFNGIIGGYTQEGSKTIIPAKASAKFSIRFVPNLTWQEVNDKVEAHIKNIAPSHSKVSLHTAVGGNPIKANIESSGIKVAEEAIQRTFGKKPYLIYGGASIPILASFQDILNLEPILLGFGLDSDDIHSPNEHFRIENLQKGIETLKEFYEIFGSK